MIIDSPIISGSYSASGSLNQSGDVVISGSLTITGGITGSISGSAISASFASNANSASYALTSSFSLNVPVTASYANNANSASFATTASNALTASYLSGYVSPFPFTGSAIISGSLEVTGSANIPNITGSLSGSLNGTASYAVTASNAVTASYLTGYVSPFPFTGSAVISGSLGVSGSLQVTNLSGSGVRYLVADESGSITAQSASAALKSTQAFTSTAGQTTFSVTNGYATGYVDVFINGSKLSTAEFTDTSGTNIVLATGSFSGDVVEVVKYTPAAGVTNNVLRQLTTLTGSAGQTVFSASYTPGLLDIFYNGSRLSPSDFTANNGTFFTLATGSAANDILDVLVYSYQVGAFSGIGGVGTADQIAFYNTTNSITGSPNFTISGSTMLITGSLTISGSSTFTNIGPAVFSGSLTSTAGFTGSFSGTATSASYAANADLLDGLDSSVFTLTSSFAAQTASFTAFTSSILSYTASQNILNGTYATTGSNTFTGIQTVNSNLIVTGSITAQTLVVQTITSSVDFVTGSTRFGSLAANTMQVTGSLLVTGSGTFTAGVTPLTVKGTNAGTMYTEYYYNTSTLVGSIGNGSGLLSGANASDFIIRSEADYVVATGGNNRRMTISSAETTFNYNPQSGSLLSGYNYLNFGGGSIMYRNATDIYIGANAKYGSAGTTVASYTSANGMGMLTMDGGILNYQSNATSVTAGTVYSMPIRFTITGGGNVGIGISGPLAKLHVETSTATDGIYLSRSTSNKQTILLSADDGVGAYIAGNTTPAGNASQTDGAGRLILQGGSTEGFQFQTSYVTGGTAASWTTRMRITNGGNVVINSTVANYKFQVNSGISTSTATVMTLQQATNGAVKDAAGFGLAIQNGGEATNAADLIISTASGGSLAERMRITNGGYLFFGTTTNSGFSATSRFKGPSSTENTDIISIDGGIEYSGYFRAVSGANYSSAGTAIIIGRNTSTGRSINAGGTINASGADYAEYMLKAIQDNISKGDIVGVNENGLLTNIFADAKSFVVKSTNPSYVGGDTWGSVDIIGKLPTDATDEQRAEYEVRLEEARAKVDRIAFSGQVPCNVYNAQVGDYIIPIELDGKISGQAVSNPTFEQYQLSVGKVWKIMEDGRAWVAVKIG